jgi:hypothetical protein
VNPYTGKEGTRVTPPNSSGDRSPGLAEPPSTTTPTESETPTESQPPPRETEAAPAPATRLRTTTEAEAGSSAGNISSTPPPAPTPTLEIAVVIAEKANLREQPNQTGTVIVEVKEGNALVLTGQPRIGGWYSVVDVITGKEGWVHGNTIRIAYKR